METVNLKEARRRLSDLIKAAERGQSTVITRRGKQVARLGPVEAKAARGLPDLSEFRASIKIKGKSLSETLAEMRAEERF